MYRLVAVRTRASKHNGLQLQRLLALALAVFYIISCVCVVDVCASERRDDERIMLREAAPTSPDADGSQLDSAILKGASELHPSTVPSSIPSLIPTDAVADSVVPAPSHDMPTSFDDILSNVYLRIMTHTNTTPSTPLLIDVALSGSYSLTDSAPTLSFGAGVTLRLRARAVLSSITDNGQVTVSCTPPAHVSHDAAGGIGDWDDHLLPRPPPLFHVASGGMLVLEGIAFDNCDITMARADGGATVEVSACSFSSDTCVHTAPTLSISGNCSVADSIFSCADWDDDAAATALALAAMQLDGMDSSGISPLADYRIAMPVVHAEGRAVVNISDCAVFRRRLMRASGVSRSHIGGTSASDCGGMCIEASDGAVVGVVESVLDGRTLVDARGNARVELNDCHVLSGAANASTGGTFSAFNCVSIGVSQSAQLSLLGGLFSLRDQCDGIRLAGNTTALVSGVSMAAFNVSFVWDISESASLTMVGTSVDAADPSVGAVGRHSGDSRATLSAVHISAVCALSASNGAVIAGEFVTVYATVNAVGSDANANAFIFADDSVGTFSDIALGATGDAVSGYSLDMRHIFRVGGQSNVTITRGSCDNCPGLIYGDGRARITLQDVIVTGQTVFPGPPALMWMLNFSIDILKGAVFVLGGNATLDAVGCSVSNLPSASFGGVGYLSGQSRAVVAGMSVDVSGGSVCGGSVFFVTDDALVDIRHSTILRLYSILFYSDVSTIGSASGAFALDGNGAIFLEYVNITHSQSVLGGVIHAMGKSSAFVRHLYVENTVAMWHGGVFSFVNESRGVLESVTVESSYASIEGGFLHADDSASVTVADAVLGNMEAYRGSLVSARGAAVVSVMRASVSNALCKLYGFVGVGGPNNRDPRFSRPQPGQVYAAVSRLGGCLAAASGAAANLSLSDVSADIVETDFAAAAIASSGRATVSALRVRVASAHAVGRAGIAWAMDDSVLEIASLSFQRSASDAEGGCLVASDAALLQVSDVDGHNTTAALTGGFLYSESGAIALLSRVTLSSSSSIRNGGFAAVIGSGVFAIDTSKLTNTRSSASGGFIFATDAARVTIRNVTVEGAEAADGGAFFLSGGALLGVTKCSFSACVARASGGWASLSATSALNVTETTLANCTSSTFGGAIAMAGASIASLINVSAAAATSGMDGGFAAQWGSSQLSITDSDFEGMAATSGNGGFVSMAGSAVARILRVAVRHTYAGSVGGVIGATGMAAQSQLHVDDCLFEDSVSRYSGAFLAIAGHCDVHVTHTQVVRAVSDRGAPGVLLRGSARLAMKDVQMFDVQRRAEYAGEGWMSAVPEAITALSDVTCENCTESFLLNSSFSISAHYANVWPGSQFDRVLSVNDVTLFLGRIVDPPQDSHVTLFLPTPVMTAAAIAIESSNAYGYINLILQRSTMRIRNTALWGQLVMEDMVSVRVEREGRAVFDTVRIVNSDVTIEGEAQFVRTDFVDGQVHLLGLGVLHCAECTFTRTASLTQRRRAISTTYGGSISPLIILEEMASAWLTNAVVRGAQVTGNGGFALMRDSSLLRMNGGRVEATSCSGDGGLVYTEAPLTGEGLQYISLNGLHIRSASANGNGGILSLTSNSAAYFQDCTLEVESVAGKAGGAFHMMDTASLTITNSSFASSRAGKVGGGFLSGTGSVTATFASVCVLSAVSDGVGGFASLASSSSNLEPSLTAVGLTVGSSQAGSNGGAFYVAGALVRVTDSFFESGYARTSGGLMHLAGEIPSDVSFIDSAFANFSSGFRGGLVSLMDESTLALDRCNVTNIASVVYGGAVVVAGGSAAIVDCAFRNTISLDGGGGSLLVQSGTLTVVRSSFKVTTAALSGGGFLLAQAVGEVTLHDVLVENSSADNAGGGVFSLSGLALLRATRVTVRDGVCMGSGGVLDIDDRAVAHFDNLSVTLSSALTGNGGAIACMGRSAVFVANATLTDIQAANFGGAISTDGSAHVSMSGVNIARTASFSGSGGAVALQSNSRANFTEVAIVNATAKQFGGVVYCGDTSVLDTVRLSSTASHATEGGFVFVGEGASARLANSTVHGATAAANGGCFYLASLNVTIRHGLYSGCHASGSQSTYGQGGFLYSASTPRSATTGVLLAAVNVDDSFASSGPVVFSQGTLDLSLVDFASIGSRETLFSDGNVTFTSPPTQLRLRFAGVASNESSLLSTVATVTSGSSLPAMNVTLLDAYGQAAFSSPALPLAIRLTVMEANSTCKLAGDLTRTFLLSSAAEFSNIRISSGTVPTQCTLGLIPDNFLYDKTLALFTSTLRVVHIMSCSVGTELVPDSAQAGMFTCVAIAEGAGGPVQSSSSSSIAVIVPVVVVVFCVCTLVCAVAYVWVRKNRQRWNQKQMEDFAQHVQSNMPALIDREIPRENIELQDVLGEGAFGVVYRAQVLLGDRIRVCACKALKPGAAVDQRIEFISEAQIMIDLSHPKLVNLVGVSMAVEPMLIVLEHVTHGSLKGFLQKIDQHRRDGQSVAYGPVFLGFALDVAEGMEFLSSRKIVHKDLAARNVLISSDLFGEYFAKVADFGLSRSTGDKDYYRKSTGGAIPIRSTPPESVLNGLYSEYSDVWSFGVLLWELYSFGQIPYAGIANADVIASVRRGVRPERPEACPDAVHRLMCTCWEKEPSDRPSFAELVSAFTIMRSAPTGDVDTATTLTQMIDVTVGDDPLPALAKAPHQILRLDKLQSGQGSYANLPPSALRRVVPSPYNYDNSAVDLSTAGTVTSCVVDHPYDTPIGIDSEKESADPAGTDGHCQKSDTGVTVASVHICDADLLANGRVGVVSVSESGV